MKCKYCGNEIANDSVFCEHCGKQLKSTPKKRNIILISVGGVVLLALGVLIGYLFLHSHFNSHSQLGDMGETISVVDEAMLQSNKNATLALQDRYNNLYAIQGEDRTEGIAVAQEKAKKLQALSDEMVKYIETVRWEMTVAVDGENAKGVKKAKAEAKNGAVPCVPVSEIEGKDNSDKATAFMIGSGDKADPNKPAAQLKKKLTEYHAQLLKFIENENGERDPNIEKQLSSVKPAEKIASKQDGKEVDWEIYNFYQLITAGQMINLNRMISEVKSAEAVVLNYIIASAGSADLSFAEYAGCSLAESKVLFSGDNYESTIMVAAFDPGQTLDVYYKVGVDQLSEAQEGSATHISGPATGVQLSVPGGGVGPHKIAGYIKVRNANTGKLELYPFKDEYVVITKGQAAISADKMNVLYAGLKNPITIAGGSDPSKLSVSFPGCQVSGSGQSRTVTPPASMIGKTVEATVTTSEGSSKMTFRVKKVPDPYAQIGANIYGGKKSKAELTANPMLVAKMSEDFAFDLKWTVQSYSVDVIEKGIISTINCTGSRFSQELINRINSASAGTVFMFSNIKISQPELGTRTMPRDITVRIK